MLNRPTLLTAGAAALTLAACAPSGDRAPTADGAIARPPIDDACGAARLGHYTNQIPTTEVIANIQKAAGHTRIRTIRPGDAVTMDFREDRLNIEIGDDGRIRLLRCG
jgi:hypothetical protein